MSAHEQEAATRSPARNEPMFVGAGRGQQPQQLADVLERVLDKGIVIVGDIQVRLLDIELLTIKIRLMVASVDRAREMGINWWEGDPFVANLDESDQASSLERRIEALEHKVDRDAGAEMPLESATGQRPEQETDSEQHREQR
ncbi:MAG TPA: gas vesicle protein [Microlunatus sp.]